ncbi:MAG: hypothetical protein K9L28_01110 [Synergistales bacterium]|nr:hypothetical protein [Synergistales bacterium]
MESILQLIMEGIGVQSSAVEACRKNLEPLVEEGRLTREDVQGITDGMASTLRERREVLLEGARSELSRVLALLPLVPQDRFQQLQERVDQLERTMKDGEPGRGESS